MLTLVARRRAPSTGQLLSARWSAVAIAMWSGWPVRPSLPTLRTRSGLSSASGSVDLRSQASGVRQALGTAVVEPAVGVYQVVPLGDAQEWARGLEGFDGLGSRAGGGDP